MDGSEVYPTDFGAKCTREGPRKIDWGSKAHYEQRDSAKGRPGKRRSANSLQKVTVHLCEKNQKAFS